MHGNDYDLFISKQLCVGEFVVVAGGENTFALHKFWLHQRLSI